MPIGISTTSLGKARYFRHIYAVLPTRTTGKPGKQLKGNEQQMKEKRPPVKMYFPNSVLLQSLLGGGGGCKQSEVTIFSRILRHPDFGPALMSLVVEGGFDSRSWGEEPAVGELGGLLALARSALFPRDPSCVFPAPKGRCRSQVPQPTCFWKWVGRTNP